MNNQEHPSKADVNKLPDGISEVVPEERISSGGTNNTTTRPSNTAPDAGKELTVPTRNEPGNGVTPNDPTIDNGTDDGTDNGTDNGTDEDENKTTTALAWKDLLTSRKGVYGIIFVTLLVALVTVIGIVIAGGSGGDGSGTVEPFPPTPAPTLALSVVEMKKLTASRGAARDGFGYSVAVNGDTIVVGAWRADDNGSSSGSAYVFTRTNGSVTWALQQKLTASDGAAADWFGYSVAVNGDTIVVGAVLDDNDNGVDSGSAYVFTRTNGSTTWALQQKLTASDGAADDEFGKSVAVHGDTIVVGAEENDNDNGVDSGSAYVFTRTNGSTTWALQQKLTASDGAADDWFGGSVAVNGDTIVVGANRDDDNGLRSGSAYVFTRTNGSVTWALQQKLTASDGAAGDQFGRGVAVHGDTIVVGAYVNRDVDNGVASGSAYVFTRTNGSVTWALQQQLTASDGAVGDLFGWSVAVHGDTIVVGAEEDDNDNGVDSGSAYVFTRSNGSTTWALQQKLTASDGAADDYFGRSVAVHGDTIVVGAALNDNDNGVDSGSAYIFDII